MAINLRPQGSGLLEELCPLLLDTHFWKAARFTKQTYSKEHNLEAFACPFPRVPNMSLSREASYVCLQWASFNAPMISGKSLS